MKNVLVIAGGEWQVPLIRRLNEQGYDVLCSNLYENSPGFQYCKKSLVVDVLDKNKNYYFAKAENVDAVLTDESDIAVPTVAYVADKLGVPGISIEKAELFTNKFKMREFCKINGFPFPEYRLCTNIDEAVLFLDQYKKMIIKPIDNQSSKGVFLVESEEELREKFDITQKYSRCEDVVLAEQYISGREFTVDAVVIDGKCTSLATSLKYQYEYNQNISRMLYFTNESKEYDLTELKKINEAIVEKMGLSFGLTHAEFKYMNEKFYLIEIAARGGGTRISSHIVPIMSGVDNYEILIKQALGEKIDKKPMVDLGLMNRKAVLEFFDFPQGKVTEIVGIEKIKEMEGIIDIHLDFKAGDVISKANDDRSRVGFYIAYAESEDELNEIRRNVASELKIKYER